MVLTLYRLDHCNQKKNDFICMFHLYQTNLNGEYILESSEQALDEKTQSLFVWHDESGMIQIIYNLPPTQMWRL